VRTPRFWFTSPAAPSPKARLLAPLGALYAAATARRVAKGRAQGGGYRAGVPVICIGNLNAGGVGKTPAVLALIGHLRSRGQAPHVVTRGYGGREHGPLRVDLDRHTSGMVGDEPLLLAEIAPVWVARDRAAGLRAAEAAGAGVILLDDGFQNSSFEKDLSIVVVDAARGFGNGLCVPAGPLREPVEAGLARADILLVIGDATAHAAFRQQWAREIGTLPVLHGELKPIHTETDWHDRPVLAFSGIGNPQKFFDTLEAEGARIVGAVPLADHQPLTRPLMARLKVQAFMRGGQLVTTQKDAVRLSSADRSQVLTLPVRLAIENWTGIDQPLSRLGL